MIKIRTPCLLRIIYNMLLQKRGLVPTTSCRLQEITNICSMVSVMIMDNEFDLRFAASETDPC